MDILATLRRSGGIEALARRLDVAPADAASCAEVLTPVIVAGLRGFVDSHGAASQSAESGGPAALATMIESLGGGELAAAVMAPGDVDAASGDAVLRALFAVEDAASVVAARAAPGEPADQALLARALPLLAMLIAGYIAARVRGSGAEGSGGLATMAEILASER